MRKTDDGKFVYVVDGSSESIVCLQTLLFTRRAAAKLMSCF
ncbi:MAG TPA: hypothetical protein VHP38_06355 [Ruminiclostridium sp.]|nr:hypothetical protein [Ruminiclostridium sp.]